MIQLNKPMAKCFVCGKDCNPSKRNSNVKKYCSPECQSKSRSMKPTARQLEIINIYGVYTEKLAEKYFKWKNARIGLNYYHSSSDKS
jgi:hypothetical protein